MVAADGEKVTLEGPTMAQLNSAGDYRWIDQAHPYLFRFSGDCTEYRATTFCAWGSQALLATSDFAGSFSLGNIGSITVDGISSATVHGAITSRDGYVRIPVATALDVRGGIDSAFADFTTHVYQGTNVYTRLAADVPYVNVNGVSGGSVGKSASVNALILSEGASLSTPMANLDGTLVSLSSNATLTVGNADFTDVILDVADDGKLVVTNSFTAHSPVKLRLDGIMAKRAALVTVPTSCGKLDVGDFTFDAPQFQYVLSVGTADGVQTLWAGAMRKSASPALRRNTSCSSAERAYGLRPARISERYTMSWSFPRSRKRIRKTRPTACFSGRTLVLRPVADLKRIVVVAEIFLYRVRQAIARHRLKLLGHHTAADKSVEPAVSVVKRVDIAEQIVKHCRAQQELLALVV